MPYQILVSNKSGVAAGEIVGAFPISHVVSAAETMGEFIKAGGLASSWSRLFSLVIGTDSSYEDIKYLSEYKGDGITKKYFFNQPPSESEEYKELLDTGQVSRTTSEILAFIGDR